MRRCVNIVGEKWIWAYGYYAIRCGKRRVSQKRKERVIVPIVKKKEGNKVEEYRSITITQTAYKVYAAVLAERLRIEIEGKGQLPPS